jgi:histidine kinase
MDQMTSNTSGYWIVSTIYDGHYTKVYRGRRQVDGLPVIIKTTPEEHPDARRVAAFGNEQEILRKLSFDGVPRVHPLDRYNGRIALIMDDIGGESLRVYMRRESLDVVQKLTIALQIAKILGEIHRKGVVHKDINPQNIIINAETKAFQIIDFAISSTLSREVPELRQPNMLQGTLLYIAPEQTGRMNRAIDSRTDLYSFGISLYEMLTGAPPFYSDDPLELVHAHIARPPVPPHEVNPEVPVAVSRIVIKLISKNAEDRYQSAFGLKADIEQCVSALRATGRVDEFPLGAQDFSDKLQMPQKLYGRDSQAEILLDTLDRANRGHTELALVTGYSGIGKSSLVNEIHRVNLDQVVTFISAKFDQFQSEAPYSTLIRAFQQFICQILSEDEVHLNAWRTRLVDSLESFTSVLVDVLPEIELVAGPQPRAAALPPRETEARFKIAFHRFVSAIASREHPLVIFLDDLQWADSASLEFIKLLVGGSGIKHLLIIGAYRDNEVTATHPLQVTIDTLQEGGTSVTTLALGPLGFEDVNQLLSDMLRCGPQRVTLLSTLLLEKTHGNPFFMLQFLRALQDDGLLTFDAEFGEWRWEQDEIQARGITDNVADLLTRKMRKLAPAAQSTLQMAALLGSRFELATLATISERAPEELAHGLWDVLAEAFVVPVGKAHEVAHLASLKILLCDAPQALSDGIATVFVFQHDRVQQAAYSLIPEPSRAETHLRIGRLLLAALPPGAPHDKVIEALLHLNGGIGLITSTEERIKVARLNLLAGRRAIASSNREQALQHFVTGLRLLPESAREDEHDLCFDLHLSAMQAELLNGRAAEALSHATLGLARSVLERVAVYETQTSFLHSRGESGPSLEISMKALRELGVELPSLKATTRQQVADAIREAEFVLGGRRPSELINLPTITDVHVLTTLRVFVMGMNVAFSLNADLFIIGACKALCICIQNGVAPDASPILSDYAISLTFWSGDIKNANDFFDAAEAIMARYGDKKHAARLCISANSWARQWRDSIRTTIAPLRDAINAALDVGEPMLAGFCAMCYCSHLIHGEEPLNVILREIDKYADLLTRLNAVQAKIVLEVFRYDQSLRTAKASPGSHEEGGGGDDESKVFATFVERFRTGGFMYAVSIIFECRVVWLYQSRRYQEALANLEQWNKVVATAGKSSFAWVRHKYYSSLLMLALYNDVSDDEKSRYMQHVESGIEALRAAMPYGSANISHKLSLIEAEKARVLGKTTEAMALYDQTIDDAAKHRLLYSEAMANELCGEFYLSIGRTRVAAAYLSEAHYIYSRWGADVVAAKLESRRGDLISLRSAAPASAITSSRTIPTSTTTEREGGLALDLSAMMKAARAISGEIVISRLLEKLLQIALEVAGAQRGLLLMNKSDRLVVEAEGVVGNTGLVTRIETRTDAEVLLPLSILHYSMRTQESVVLGDASADARFAADRYIVSAKPKSVLCSPLIDRRKATAVLYLENNLVQDAFTYDRVEMLRLLLSQASLSIHNSTLYAQVNEYNRTLEQTIDERTRQLRAAQARLLKVEREAIELQLAGGFAHEVRNALVAAQIVMGGEDKKAGPPLSHMLEEMSTRVVAESPADAHAWLVIIGRTLGKMAQFAQTAEKRQAHIRGVVEKAFGRALKITSTILEYSRLGQEQPGRDLLPVRSLIEQIAGESEADFAEYAISFVINVTDTCALRIEESHLYSIVKNLVINARDAILERSQSLESDAPQPERRIEVALVEESDTSVLRVTDTGAGISDEHRTRLFQPFFSTKPSTGTGLGLSVVEKLVSLYGGRIEVTSEVDRGTCFSVVLPSAARAEVEAVE